MPLLKIKPLSVNKCWKGKRIKTDDYLVYEKELYYLLPKTKVPKTSLGIEIEIGVSSKLADLDNIIKPFLDILQLKYKFNDNEIYRIIMDKEIVKKGDEYIDFNIYQVN